MNTLVSRAAIAALFLSTAASLCAQKTWYVRRYPTTTGADGSQLKPYNDLAQVEAAAKAGDTIMVIPSEDKWGPLTGGIKLKKGQKLLGMGPKVTTLPPPKVRAWISNHNTVRHLGDAVVLADDCEVGGVHIGTVARCAVFGSNVTGANLHDLLVTGWNTSGAKSPRPILSGHTLLGGIEFFMHGNDTTRKSNRCTDCRLDNGPGNGVLLETHNVTKADLLVQGTRVTNANGIWVTAYGTTEAKLVVKNCSADDLLKDSRGVAAYSEEQPRLTLEVDGFTFESTKKLQPLNGVQMVADGAAKLSFRVENCEIRDCAAWSIECLNWRNDKNAKGELDANVANNVVSGPRGIGFGAWNSGDLGKLRSTVRNNRIDTTGDAINLYCNSTSRIDDAVVVIDGNTVRGGPIVYYNESGIGNISFAATGNVARNASPGIHAEHRGTVRPKGTILFANNVVSNATSEGISIAGSAATFVNNTSTGNGTYGLTTNNAPATIVNNLLWGNTVGGIQTNGFPKPTVTFNNVQGGHTGTGNIDKDPLFIDAKAGDYHLRYDSPCRNKGSNAAVTIKTDFEGDPRVADSTVDMGADEFFPHLYYTGSLTPGGTARVNVIGAPNTDVLWGISGVAGAYDPPVKVPGLGGVLYLRDPIILVPLGKTPAKGVVQQSLPIPGTFPKVSAWTQALVGTTLTNLSIATVK